MCAMQFQFTGARLWTEIEGYIDRLSDPQVIGKNEKISRWRYKTRKLYLDIECWRCDF